MTDTISIEIAGDLPPGDAAALADEVRALADVRDAGTETVRGIDAASLELWVQIATGLLTTVSTAIPLIRGLRQALGRRGVRTATIELPDGTKVTTDMTDDQLEQLLTRT